MTTALRWLMAAAVCTFSAYGQTYFQQKVDYQIRAAFWPDQNRIDGVETLVYHNQSPDTLQQLYFHLYWNKYEDHSYFDPEATGKKGGMAVNSVISAAGDSLAYSIDNTIMRLSLNDTPFPPGDSLALKISFTGHFPLIEGRFGAEGTHFVAGHWYPVPAVYDAAGWHADQHLDGEFYHEWGDYRVEIEVPRWFAVAGSGVLLNPEVLPDSLENPDYFPEEDSSRVTYRFLAENVHDFTWIADPDLFRVQTRYHGVTINFFIQRNFQEDWQEAIEVTPRAMAFLEEKIGPYPYPVLNIVSSYVTSGGMEYPNLVYINNVLSSSREYSIVVIHEVIHQWFYGLLANHQTRYGWMDEGLTSFFEIWCTEFLWGEEDNLAIGRSGLSGRFAPSLNARQQSFLNYAELALSGREERIDQHFDYFRDDPYTPTYDKAALVFRTLKNILGDSLFLAGIRDYYQNWRYRHPGPADLFRSFERASAQELEWFWEPFLQSTDQFDVALTAVRRLEANPFNDSASYQYELSLVRRQPLLLPMDIDLELKDGSRKRYRIPVAAASYPQPPAGGIELLPPWHPAHPDYRATVSLNLPLASVEIDPDESLPDLNRFNNDDRLLPRLRGYWLRKQYLNPRGDAYPVTFAPFLFYSDPDGIQLGLQSRGEYLAGQYAHYARIMMGHRAAWPDVWLEWQNRIAHDSPQVRYWLRGVHSGGRLLGEAGIFGFGKPLPYWQIGYRVFKRTDDDFFRYDAWDAGTTGELFLNFQILGGSAGRIWSWAPLQVFAAGSSIGSEESFQQVTVDSRQHLDLPLLPEMALRLKAGASRGSLPLQRRFEMGQANSLQRFSHLYARSPGTIPAQWRRDGHYMVPGGADVRAALAENTTLPTGEHFLAGEMRLPFFDTFYRFPFRLDPLTELEFSLFSSWAQVWDGDAFLWQNFWGEAGISVHYEFTPLLIRYFHISGMHVDFPLWFHRPGGAGQAWKFRWVLRLDLNRFYR